MTPYKLHWLSDGSEYVWMCLLAVTCKGLVIYHPAIGGWSNLKWDDKNFKPPSQSYGKIFDPPHVKNEKILAPLDWWIWQKIVDPLFQGFQTWLFLDPLFILNTVYIFAISSWIVDSLFPQT